VALFEFLAAAAMTRIVATQLGQFTSIGFYLRSVMMLMVAIGTVHMLVSIAVRRVVCVFVVQMRFVFGHDWVVRRFVRRHSTLPLRRRGGHDAD
jgi:hypothetical protein